MNKNDKGAAPMPFFNEKTGSICLAREHALSVQMSAEEVLAVLQKVGGDPPAIKSPELIPFPACEAAGGMVAPVVFLEQGQLSTIQLSVTSVGQKSSPTADQQRAFLFSLLRCKDPCPDTRRTCRILCDFGTATFSTDPRTGCAHLRLSYMPSIPSFQQ